jgi:hypothetical protein
VRTSFKLLVLCCVLGTATACGPRIIGQEYGSTITCKTSLGQTYYRKDHVKVMNNDDVGLTVRIQDDQGNIHQDYVTGTCVVNDYNPTI